MNLAYLDRFVVEKMEHVCVSTPTSDHVKHHREGTTSVSPLHRWIVIVSKD